MIETQPFTGDWFHVGEQQELSNLKATTPLSSDFRILVVALGLTGKGPGNRGQVIGSVHQASTVAILLSKSKAETPSRHKAKPSSGFTNQAGSAG